MDKKQMADDDRSAGSAFEAVVRRTHSLDLGIRFVVAIAAIVGAMGSLAAKTYGQLGFGPTLVIALLLALLVTQIPLVASWRRQRFYFFRSISPLVASLIAGGLIIFIYAADYLPKLISDGPSPPAGASAQQIENLKAELADARQKLADAARKPSSPLTPTTTPSKAVTETTSAVVYIKEINISDSRW